jgi:hypothetical protein
MHKRRSLAWLVVVAVGLMLIPAAGASASNASAAYNKKDSRLEKRQNARINRVVRNAKILSKAVTTQGTALNTKTDGIDARLKVIEGAAPQIVKGLTDLKDGLTKLQTGLESAGAGLTKLGDAYRAIEYGTAGVYKQDDTQIGPFIQSGDIPDDGNGAAASGSIPAPLAAGDSLRIQATIRSNEADGANGDPAGQVGAVLYVTCASSGQCGGGPTSGAVSCTPAQTPPAQFTTPAGNLTLSLVNIPTKSSETDPTTPGPDEGVDATAGARCQVATAGLYIVTVQTQFFDLPTSTTPGPRD